MTGRTVALSAAGRAPALPGSAFPLGATGRDGGANFAVAAGGADSMLLCLFGGNGAETQIPLLDYDAGVWHGFVPGVGAGQAYGHRAAGRYDPGLGLRINPAKLLLDPCARAIAGAVRFGPGPHVGPPSAGGGFEGRNVRRRDGTRSLRARLGDDRIRGGVRCGDSRTKGWCVRRIRPAGP